MERIHLDFNLVSLKLSLSFWPIIILPGLDTKQMLGFSSWLNSILRYKFEVSRLCKLRNKSLPILFTSTFLFFIFSISWLHTQKMNFDVNEQWAFDFIKVQMLHVGAVRESTAVAHLNNHHQTLSKKIFCWSEAFSQPNPSHCTTWYCYCLFFQWTCWINLRTSSYTKL